MSEILPKRKHSPHHHTTLCGPQSVKINYITVLPHQIPIKQVLSGRRGVVGCNEGVIPLTHGGREVRSSTPVGAEKDSLVFLLFFAYLGNVGDRKSVV